MGWGNGEKASDAIWAMLQVYRDEMTNGQRSELEESGERAIELLDKIESLTSTLNHRADHLRGRSPFIEIVQCMSELREVDRNERFLEFVFERVNLLLTEQAVEFAESSQDRWWKLIELVRPINASKRSRRFLRRVSRCFMYDLQPECAVMCRSVLDAALESEISNDLCSRMLSNTPTLRQFTLADRIEVARKTGRLSFEGAEAARRVQRAGNSVVHEDAAHVDDAYPLIRDVLTLLAELDAGLGSGER